MIAPYELAAGLVARFDPAQLLANGGAPDRPPGLAVAGPHYFVCLGRCGRYSVWTPVFTRHRPGREKIGWKSGLADWANQDSYVDLTQLWVIPDEAVDLASRSTDRSQRGSRNRASLSFLIAAADRYQAG